MSNPYIGQVTPFAFPFAPAYWAFCNGGTMSINQSTTLFSLLGTAFGGDGRTTFGLPNLNAVAPCGTGQGPGLTQRSLGQAFGSATVTLDLTTLPPHQHGMNALSLGRGSSGASAIPLPTAGLAAQANNITPYAGGSPNATMSPAAISTAGGGGAHNNLQPSLTINYAIALQGTYPYFG